MSEELEVCKLKPNIQFKAKEIVLLSAVHIFRKSALRIFKARSASYM
jgi:hypothetical protein